MTTSELLHSPRRSPVRAPATHPSARTARPRTPDAPAGRPAWARPALAALLLLTAVAYIWDLSASGYANSFYAAAVQAGTKSWKAMFFGSLDSSNFITVDKPPASLWVMSLSGRIFGFSSMSMLVPQALEGVAAVALLYAAVRRWFGAGAGLLAGAVLAATPVAALMFRYNNPDALLVLALVAGAYCLVRALERAGTRWVLAAGAMIGFAFLAKMMQAFLVLPAFALVYAVAAPTTLPRRIGQIAAGGAAMVLSAGWWVAIVAFWPAGSRPMIDGSPDNSILNLIFGYNGLGRIVGASGPGGGGTGFSGATGPLRLFNELMGGQASWLLPAALLALAAGLWARRRAPRTDRTRAALLLWGGWLVVTAIVFSFASGVIHTYYTVALAPAIAALVAIGAAMFWSRRETAAARLTAAVAVGASAVWAAVLLARTPAFEPWLRPAVLIAGGASVAVLLLAPLLGSAVARRATAVAAVLAALAIGAGPLAYSGETIASAHSGSIVSAGPATAGGFGAGGGAPGAGGASGLRGTPGAGAPSRPPGGAPGSAGFGGAPQGVSGAASGGAHAAFSGAGRADATTSAALVKLLRSGAGGYRWAAATSGSQSAASLELASNEAVMAIGGFNNEGGNLSLATFERYVSAGEVHYYIASGGGGGGGGAPGANGSSSSIAAWVKAHFAAQTVGGQTVYDLTRAA